MDREQAITMVLAAGVGIATVDYVGWRISVTNWHGWWVAVPLLCAEALGAVHVVGFQFTVWPRPAPLIDPTCDPTRLPIFIFVPTVNEGVAVVRKTLEGCLAARAKYACGFSAAAADSWPRATRRKTVCSTSSASAALPVTRCAVRKTRS